MTAHKYAEMIKAKADNVELVVFCKDDSIGDWFEYGRNGMYCPFHEEDCYFICHPKHADVCLHWLNGGKVEFFYGLGWAEAISKDAFGEWEGAHFFMRENEQARIKPRKEKRWIGYHEYGHTTSMAYLSKDDVMLGTINHEKWQFIEIEVEV